MKRAGLFLIGGLVVIGLVAAYCVWLGPLSGSSRTRSLLAYLRNPRAHDDWVTPALQRCGDAPFLMPTSGYIGYLWDDSFRPGHHHSGIDVFGGREAGEVPVYAAHDGYLTRQSDWKSTVIIRVPSDPLNPGTQVWTYYTHMADKNGNSFIVDAFPPGASEAFVSAGTLLGYQGNYSGTPGNPTGVHLHFSIVRDDGAGGYLNELEINNTYDPSLYLGMLLNNQAGGVTPVYCNP